MSVSRSGSSKRGDFRFFDWHNVLGWHQSLGEHGIRRNPDFRSNCVCDGLGDTNSIRQIDLASPKVAYADNWDALRSKVTALEGIAIPELDYVSHPNPLPTCGKFKLEVFIFNRLQRPLLPKCSIPDQP